MCKHPYTFSPIYARDTPIRLSCQEFLLGVLSKITHSAKFCTRLLLVIYVWFLFVPFITYWMWRCIFVQNFAEAQKLFISRFTPILFLIDCLYGLLLSISIVFTFLGATSVREYFRHMQEFNANLDIGNMRMPLVDHRVVLNEQMPNFGANNVNELVRDHILEDDNILPLNVDNLPLQLEMQAAQLEARIEHILNAPNDMDIGDDVPFNEFVGIEGPLHHLVENAMIVSKLFISFVCELLIFVVV